jgi:uncharacterized protein YjaG (DUF416 family)
MYVFDESRLVRELEVLPPLVRISFASAAATRLLSSYERFANSLRKSEAKYPREIAIHLWNDLRSSEVDRINWQIRLNEVMGLLPEESDDWEVSHAFADDAISSLAYAIRCLLVTDPQEAIWAARRAYEAADQAAIRMLGVQPGLLHTEAAVSSIDEVQRLAFENDLLTEEEAASIQ